MLRVKDMQMDVRGYSSFTVGAAAVTITSVIAGMGITNYRGVYMSVEGADVRWRADGTDPTGVEGHMLYETEDCEAYDPNMVFLGKLRFILDSAAGVNATIRISVY